MVAPLATGDGARVLGTKFINFLCHEKGKGVMLIKIKDCTERLSEVGTIQATFIAHVLIQVIKYVGPESVYLVIVDGRAEWVAGCTTNDSTAVSMDSISALCDA